MEPSNVYENGAALQGLGADIYAATPTKELPGGGGRGSHSGICQNTRTVLKSPPLITQLDTKQGVSEV